MKTINDVRIGDIIKNNSNGIGIVTNKTKRTITITFENGNKVKNTYRYSDDYFLEGDFN